MGFQKPKYRMATADPTSKTLKSQYQVPFSADETLKMTLVSPRSVQWTREPRGTPPSHAHRRQPSLTRRQPANPPLLALFNPADPHFKICTSSENAHDVFADT